MKAATVESLLAHALEHVQVGIVVLDFDGGIVFTNGFFRRCFAMTDEQCARGAPFATLVRQVAAREGDAAAPERAERRLAAMAAREPWHELRQRPDGQCLVIHGEPLPDGYICTYADITAERQAAERLRRSYKAAVVALADLAEHRDGNTGEHVLRVASLAHEIALALRHAGNAEVTDELCSHIATASILHDVGKVVVPDDILHKPGPLDPAERTTMETHAAAGAQILEKATLLAPESQFFRIGTAIAEGHHERYDGKGYPRGLAGADIPLPARIAAVADVFDALVSERPYKAAWPRERAVALIRDGAGSQFDPDVVRAFLDVIEERAQITVIEWTPELSVGEAFLDRDHRALIGLLNQLASKSCREDRVTLELVLDELFGYTVGHFAREEAYMMRIGFDGLARHRRIHQGLADRLIAIRDRFIVGNDRAIGDEVLDFLGRWLRQHIMEEDHRYMKAAKA